MAGIRANLEKSLSASPSQLAFRAICGLFDRMASDEFADSNLLKSAAQLLDEWPDECRSAPCFSHGLSVYTSANSWPLVRNLQGADVSEIVRAGDSVDLSNIRMLSVHLRQLSHDDFVRFDLTQIFPALNCVRLSGGGLDATQLCDFFQFGIPTSVKQFGFFHMQEAAWPNIAAAGWHL